MSSANDAGRPKLIEREFQVGDLVTLKEPLTDPFYEGRTIVGHITSITDGINVRPDYTRCNYFNTNAVYVNAWDLVLYQDGDFIADEISDAANYYSAITEFK